MLQDGHLVDAHVASRFEKKRHSPVKAKRGFPFAVFGCEHGKGIVSPLLETLEFLNPGLWVNA